MISLYLRKVCTLYTSLDAHFNAIGLRFVHIFTVWNSHMLFSHFISNQISLKCQLNEIYLQWHYRTIIPSIWAGMSAQCKCNTNQIFVHRPQFRFIKIQKWLTELYKKIIRDWMVRAKSKHADYLCLALLLWSPKDETISHLVKICENKYQIRPKT